MIIRPKTEVLPDETVRIVAVAAGHGGSVRIEQVADIGVEGFFEEIQHRIGIRHGVRSLFNQRRCNLRDTGQGPHRTNVLREQGGQGVVYDGQPDKRVPFGFPESDVFERCIKEVSAGSDGAEREKGQNQQDVAKPHGEPPWGRGLVHSENTETGG